ncbi:MAG: hypothetical protein ACXVYS_18485 [Oryzihumus sp.]
MFAFGLFALVPLALLVLVGLVVAIVLAATARPDTTLSSEVASARRHAVAVSALAVAVLLATPLAALPALRATTTAGEAGTWYATVPLIAASTALLVLLVGELTWPRPSGSTRTALLHARSARDLVTGRWAQLAAGATGPLVLFLLVAGLVADPGGKVLLREHVGGTASHGPFPGFGYGVPQLVALALALVLVALVLRATHRRAAVVAADLDTDRLLRRASAARAFKLLLIGVLLTLAPDLAFAGSAVADLYDHGPVHALGIVLAVLGPLLGLAGLAALLVPAPRLPRTPVAHTQPTPA